MPDPGFLEDSHIIVAHADDEMLWFSSILDRVDRVTICYLGSWMTPHLRGGRERALAEYPRGAVATLEIEESGSYGCADWQSPELGPYGMTLGMRAHLRSLRHLPKLALSTSDKPATIGARYEENYHAIKNRLAGQLTPKSNVFTHNPWGEYGHEEHVQVFRVLDDLRLEIGFKLWISNYCSDRSFPLASRYLARSGAAYVTLPTNKPLAADLMALYKRHDCWTWADQWDWFETESFMEAPNGPADPAAEGHIFPLNMMKFAA